MSPDSPAEGSLPGVRASPDHRPTNIPKLPPSVPDHDLIRRIGGGSYGEVWLARNVMGTFRAVKIVYRQNFDHDRPFEREFKGIQKFEPISRSHEGLVDILHVGRGEGYFFYVMELADAGEPVVSNQWPVISNQAGGGASALMTDALITDYFPRTLRSDLDRRRRLPVVECLAIGQTLASAL